MHMKLRDYPMVGWEDLDGRTRESLRVHTHIWILNLHLNANYGLFDCNCKFRLVSNVLLQNTCANFKINVTWFDIVILV